MSYLKEAGLVDEHTDQEMVEKIVAVEKDRIKNYRKLPELQSFFQTSWLPSRTLNMEEKQ